MSLPGGDGPSSMHGGVLVCGCRCHISEGTKRDSSVSKGESRKRSFVLCNVYLFECVYQDLDTLLAQLQGLIEASALESNDDKEERALKISTINTRITAIRGQMDAANDQTALTIHQLKVSSSNPGAQYYWILLVLMYGGVYLMN